MFIVSNCLLQNIDFQKSRTFYLDNSILEDKILEQIFGFIGGLQRNILVPNPMFSQYVSIKPKPAGATSTTPSSYLLTPMSYWEQSVYVVLKNNQEEMIDYFPAELTVKSTETFDSYEYIINKKINGKASYLLLKGNEPTTTNYYYFFYRNNPLKNLDVSHTASITYKVNTSKNQCYLSEFVDKFIESKEIVRIIVSPAEPQEIHHPSQREVIPGYITLLGDNDRQIDSLPLTLLAQRGENEFYIEPIKIDLEKSTLASLDDSGNQIGQNILKQRDINITFFYR